MQISLQFNIFKNNNSSFSLNTYKNGFHTVSTEKKENTIIPYENYFVNKNIRFCSSYNENLNENKEAIGKALKILGKKNVSLIVHGSSFPSFEDKNIGYGSPNSQATKEFFDYISGIFNTIQLGPAGKTSAFDPSPYAGSTFSSNPLFIDLEQLTMPKWNSILSNETYNKICSENSSKALNQTSYSYAFEKNKIALDEAYENFKKIGKPEQKAAFVEFKKNNIFWLKKDAIFELLSKKYGNDDWKNWKGADKRLFAPHNEREAKICENRIKKLVANNKDFLNRYAFAQFVYKAQNDNTKAYMKSKGLTTIADKQVAFSTRDYWAYQSYFLKGIKLGAAPDMFSATGQSWDFPTINPRKLFNKDGSLGEAGILLKNVYKKIFSENPGGVRIDNALGLIDPWTYPEGSAPLPECGAFRLYSSPENNSQVKNFSIPKIDDIDFSVPANDTNRVKTLTDKQIKKYARFLKYIVMDAAKEAGLKPSSIICEDLGVVTYPSQKVLEKLKLRGMKITTDVEPEDNSDPRRCKNIIKKTWAICGTHDHPPLTVWAQQQIDNGKSENHAKALVQDLYSYKSVEEQNELVERISKDPLLLRDAKFTELFASKAQNHQIFFADLFGMEEIYNTPGTPANQNWKLRIPNNYRQFYEEGLKNGKSLNLTKILADAIRARGQKFADKNQELINKLDELSKNR